MDSRVFSNVDAAAVISIDICTGCYIVCDVAKNAYKKMLPQETIDDIILSLDKYDQIYSSRSLLSDWAARRCRYKDFRDAIVNGGRARDFDWLLEHGARNERVAFKTVSMDYIRWLDSIDCLVVLGEYGESGRHNLDDILHYAAINDLLELFQFVFERQSYSQIHKFGNVAVSNCSLRVLLYIKSYDTNSNEQ